MDVERITQKLAGCVGPANVSVRPVEMLFNGLDAEPGRLHATMYGRVLKRRAPSWVVWPSAAAEVARVVQTASSEGLALVPYGGGTNLSGSIQLGDDRPVVVVDLKRMDAVLELDETSLVAHVQAGILGADLVRTLAARRLSLGHLPTSLSFSTLGGWLATHGAGLAMGRHGRIDDLCLSLSAVLPDGGIIHTRPAPRKATGPDFMHLFLGSEGLFGIVTSARLRLTRETGPRKSMAAGFPDLHQALSAASAMILSGLRPLELAVVDPDQSQAFGGDENWSLLCSFGGLLAGAEADEALDAVRDARGRLLDQGMVARWKAWRWSKPFDDLERRAKEIFVDELDFAVSWDRAGDAAQAVQSALVEAGAHCRVELGMPSGPGLCLLVSWEHSGLEQIVGDGQGGAFSTVEEYQRLDSRRARLWSLVVEAAVGSGAMPFHHRGVGRLRAEFMRRFAPGDVWMAAQVKQRLDPNGIMNPWLWESVTANGLEDADAR